MGYAQIILDTTISEGTNELARCGSMLNDLGAVCTYPAELDKFAFVCGMIGMIIGWVSMWLFQKSRAGGKEIAERMRHEKNESALPLETQSTFINPLTGEEITSEDLDNAFRTKLVYDSPKQNSDEKR